MLNKYNLKTLEHKIISCKVHDTKNENKKDFEPMAVLFLDGFNEKNSSK